MEYSGDGSSVYSEAKGEYTRQLCQYLTPALQKYFLDMIDIAKEREPESKKQLLSFQTLLEGVSEWNVDKVQREVQSIAISTQCDYLEELLTAVFIAHTKVLSSIRLTNKHRKLQITIPKLEHFIHRTLIECSRLLWTHTFLFANIGTSIERQKNMRQIETLITEGVLQGVRSMLPVKSILREYLATDEAETDEEDEEEAEEEEEEKEVEPEAEAEPEPKKRKAKHSDSATETAESTGAVDVTGATAQFTEQKNNPPMFNPSEHDIFTKISSTTDKELENTSLPVTKTKGSIVTVQKEEVPAKETDGPKALTPVRSPTPTQSAPVIDLSNDITQLNYVDSNTIMEMDDFTNLDDEEMDDKIEFEEL